ncbi:hypothetical protein ACFLU4_09070 [Chloroflexota bacterium]
MATDNPQTRRPALYLWISGMAFAIVFTVLIWVSGPNLKPFTDTYLPDQGAAWYYWQLPSRDFWGMVIAWVMYLGHQFSLWTAIYFAQRDHHGFRSKLLLGLPRYSWVATIINMAFVCLHLLQTHVWFDGLAQDVPIMTSQASVVIMLAVVLILETLDEAFC